MDVLKQIAGSPDYAIIALVWPWPDGGWMAGCILIDKDYAFAQGLAIGTLEEVGLDGEEWNMFDGFKNGLNTLASTPEEALIKLHNQLKEGS